MKLTPHKLTTNEALAISCNQFDCKKKKCCKKYKKGGVNCKKCPKI